MSRRSKIVINFDEKFLKSLALQDNSGVALRVKSQHLVLHPVHLNNINNSLKDILSEGIPKYNKDLEGVLLGFEKIKLLSHVGAINYDTCGVHVDVSANFFVFQPEIGAEMQGTVNRKSKDHVGVLVYKSFNVSIPKPPEDEQWLGESVNIGDEVKFCITLIDFSSYLPYIRGTLLSIVTRNPAVTLNTQSKTVNKKIIFDESTGEPMQDDTLPIEDVTGTEKVAKKKKKVKNNSISLNTTIEDLISSTLAEKQIEVQGIKRKRSVSEGSDLSAIQDLKERISKKRKKKDQTDVSVEAILSLEGEKKVKKKKKATEENVEEGC